MFVIDLEGNIFIGNRDGQRNPHPTLIGGKNPQVLAAGMIDIRKGKIYLVNNESGHFKPGNESLTIIKQKFGEIPKQYFHKNFQGYHSYGE